ncbi:circadian associated repressor of transcription a [Cheilinus undulatus]|uniref:circadian associated repressor of transcription a n=1 Tax=Cheilinus undulatus TaxID=241271 RepID=UPI001BD55BF9|nr:circadian associated repressor of transcription a [Cheilinus undulatus]
MNSLGSSSKWPSYDSIPSTSSFLHSENEQTEDEAEADVFSEGEGDNVGTRKSPSEITLQRSYLHFPVHSDHLRSNNQSECCSDKTPHPISASCPGAAMLGSNSVTPGDLAFAQKCADLRRFIHPLLELLHGLQAGRFEKGLSSFQQSVAMDRLQKILGILQRPEMGEKHLHNLLQIEMMLKIWFPHVASRSTHRSSQTTPPRLHQRWRKNQLHMPVKKRKLSWTDSDFSGTVITKHKHQRHGKDESCQATTPLQTISTSLPGSSLKLKTPEAEETLEAAGSGCKAGHEFSDGFGTPRRQPYLCLKRESENLRTPETSLSSPCGCPAAQDSSVSSSNIISASDSP